MTSEDLRKMADLLKEASSAHNEYEQKELNGIYDQGWPNWYAAFLVNHGINHLLGEVITVETLARQLAGYDTEYRAQQRQESWPNFYAARLLEPRNRTEE